MLRKTLIPAVLLALVSAPALADRLDTEGDWSGLGNAQANPEVIDLSYGERLHAERNGQRLSIGSRAASVDLPPLRDGQRIHVISRHGASAYIRTLTVGGGAA